MYNLKEYKDNYLKTLEGLWQYYWDEPNDNITQLESFKSKIKITGKTRDCGNLKNVVVAVPLKHLSNFWRTLEMLLINCEINLILTWSVTFLLQLETLYVPIVTLSTQDNAKRLEQLKSGFKRTINWNRHQPKCQKKEKILFRFLSWIS